MKVKSSVLLISGRHSHASSLGRYVAEFHALGADVWLAGMTDVERSLPDAGLDGLRSLKVRADDRGPEFYRRSREATFPVETALHVEADPWVLRRAARADVIVAIDLTAVYSVWRLAKRFPGPAAVSGLKAGLNAVAGLDDHRVGDVSRGRSIIGRGSERSIAARRAIRQRTRAALRTTASNALRGVARSRPTRAFALRAPITRLLTTSGLPLRRRISFAADLVLALRTAGSDHEADALLDRLMSALATRRDRANLLGEVAIREIAVGRQPHDIVRAYAAELDYADALLASGRGDQAAASLLQAARLAFHRAIHFDSTASPLAADPAGFTAPFNASQVVRSLTEPRGRKVPLAPRPGNDVTRVLIASHGNTSFLGSLHSHLEGRSEVEVAMIDLTDLGAAAGLARDPQRMLASLLSGAPTATRLAERQLRPHLDWADVIFVDWCTSLIRVINLVDPEQTRVILRLHSYEAFTAWPLLLDLSRVDHLVFVSEHIRDLVTAQRPELADSSVCETSVIPNAIELNRLVLPKEPTARFTIGLIGFNVVAKDVRWAVQVLRRLREVDDRYRLLLIGADFQDHLSPAARAYGEGFRRDLAELEPSGAIVRFGYTTDLAKALTRVGVILCSSVREGFPVGLLEAAATGAVPVVRNWPFFASLPHNARSMYPAEWIVETVDEAADRVRVWTQDEDLWSQASARVSADVLARWDVTEIGEHYDELILR